jgi:fluoride ion exporter CrcB/FEX
MGITLFEVVLVALGGIIGSLLRWQCIEALPTLAIGVFVVNQLGVLVAGFVAYRMRSTQYQRRFWINGFAGGFTTMSSLAYILHESTPLRGFGYALASLLVSMLIVNLLRDKATS